MRYQMPVPAITQTQQQQTLTNINPFPMIRFKNLQVILPLECLAAQLARESPLVAVRQFVLGQRRRAGKHFAAHLRKGGIGYR